MAVIGWGKPRIFIKDLDASSPKWEELPTPVEDSTQLTTTKGDKQEAKIEGGENEDVKYGKILMLLLSTFVPQRDAKDLLVIVMV